MKQAFIVLFMSIVILGINAQHRANIEISYSAHYPNMRNVKEDLKSKYVLWLILANQNFSLRRRSILTLLTSNSLYRSTCRSLLIALPLFKRRIYSPAFHQMKSTYHTKVYNSPWNQRNALLCNLTIKLQYYLCTIKTTI